MPGTLRKFVVLLHITLYTAFSVSKNTAGAKIGSTAVLIRVRT
jgi:hypothetical protein